MSFDLSGFFGGGNSMNGSLPLSSPTGNGAQTYMGPTSGGAQLTSGPYAGMVASPPSTSGGGGGSSGGGIGGELDKSIAAIGQAIAGYMMAGAQGQQSQIASIPNVGVMKPVLANFPTATLPSQPFVAGG